MTEKQDDFLGGKIRLLQSDDGYRATSDAVLLASSVLLKKNETILDVGIGTGAVSLCLCAREPTVKITGVDVQSEMLEASQKNAALNGFDFELIKGDVSDFVPELKGRQFHHVVTNPPYFKEDNLRQNKMTAIAYKENVPLSDWIDFCLKKVRPKGTFSIIHRSDRLADILSAVNGRLGNILVVPFWPKQGVSPKRILVQGVVGKKTPLNLHAGFVMHDDDGNRNEHIEAVMREGKYLFD